MHLATPLRRKLYGSIPWVFAVLAVVTALCAGWRLLLLDEEGNEISKRDRVRDFFASAGNFRCPMPVYYSSEEVARHSSDTDLWIVIDSNVLDVSSFLQQHPGGPLILEAAGGNDAAALFSRHHEPSIVHYFDKYCIGRLRG